MVFRTEKDFLFSGNTSTWQVHRELFICTEQKEVKSQLGSYSSRPDGPEWGEKKTDGVGLFKAKLKDLKSFLKLK